MSQLLQQIRDAQIRAAENVVVANLHRMGLDHSQQPRAERDAPTALAASIAAQAETKRRNDEAARAAALKAEAAAIGAELDPDALEQGDPL